MKLRVFSAVRTSAANRVVTRAPFRGFASFSRQNIQIAQSIRSIPSVHAAVGLSVVVAGCLGMASAKAKCEAAETIDPAAPAAPAALAVAAPAAAAPVVATATGEENPFQDTDYRYLGFTGRVARVLAFGANKVRYLGFASDIGESTRPLLDPKYVKGFYAVTWAYIFGDVAYNMYTEHEKSGDNMMVARTGIRVMTFQSVCSVALPTLIIHTAVHQSQRMFVNAPGRMKVVGPVLVGLSIIPFLPFIDEPAEEIIHHGFDKYWPVPGSQHKEDVSCL